MFWEEEEMRDQEQKTRDAVRYHKDVKKAERRGRPAGTVRRKKRKKRSLVFNLMIVVFVCVFLFSAYRLYGIFSVYYHNWKVGAELQDLYYKETARVEDAGREQRVENPLAALQNVNPDVNAWIRIEDTGIDYPVVQGTDNSYYLDHNVYGESTVCGSIFMDCNNQLGAPRENYILYGHRMKDDSMFGELSKFLKEDFLRTHPSFTLMIGNTTYTCEIFAVVQTTVDRFSYGVTQFPDEGSQTAYVEQCRNLSLYETDTVVAPTDSLVTLSTCDYKLDANTGRLVVFAKLTPPRTGAAEPAAYDSSEPESTTNGDGAISGGVPAAEE